MTEPISPKQDRFVNPYSFAPLRNRVDRRSPRPHNAMHDEEGAVLLCGAIDVTWRLVTPLLLPESAEGDGWLSSDGVSIPGSSIKGLVRATHEAQFNGCLRILDSDFIPAHRNPPNHNNEAADRGAGLALAVVTASREGTPLEVALCDEIVWIEASSLARALGQPPESGDIIECPQAAAPKDGVLGRKEVDPVTRAHLIDKPQTTTVDGVASCVLDPGHRVVLVTDTAARTLWHKSSDKIASCFWASGSITDRALPVPDGVVDRFRMAVYGARDLQERRRLDGATRNREPVRWWDAPGRTTIPRRQQRARTTVVGYRRRASAELYPGDVVWVREAVDASGEPCVKEILLSLIWRDLGDTPVGERLPQDSEDDYPAALACRHPYPRSNGTDWPDGFPIGLCPTCRLFGMADTTGAARGRGEQEAFAGRIRFGSACAEGVTPEQPFRLAPRGNPHPSAGGFYLEHRWPIPEAQEGDVAAHWGSAIDTKSVDNKALTPRLIRGRKFYWHSDPDGQAAHWSQETGHQVRARYVAGAHHANRQTREARLIPAGTHFTSRLTIDGVSTTEVIELLAALDPTRILRLIDRRPERRFGVRLGGGKGFGLGSAQVSELTCHLVPITSRYTGQSQVVDEDAFVVSDDFLRRQHRRSAIGRLGELARLLDIDGLGPWVCHVAYPPDTTWDNYDSPQLLPPRMRITGAKAFDNSYAFFTRCSGRRDADERRAFDQLPVVPDDPKAPFDPTLETGRQT